MTSRYGPGFPWSPEAVELLREMRGKGLSSSQIAKELSRQFSNPVSRSAVIGKLSRMGIEMPLACKRETISLANRARVPRLPKASPKPKAANDEVRSRRAAQLIRHEREKAGPPVDVPAVHPDLIATAPAGIMALRLDSCRWPLERTDEHGDTLFCCNTRSRGLYCEGHAKRAFTRANVKSAADAQSDAERRAKQLAPFVAGRFAWSKGLVRRSA